MCGCVSRFDVSKCVSVCVSVCVCERVYMCGCVSRFAVSKCVGMCVCVCGPTGVELSTAASRQQNEMPTEKFSQTLSF